MKKIILIIFILVLFFYGNSYADIFDIDADNKIIDIVIDNYNKQITFICESEGVEYKTIYINEDYDNNVDELINMTNIKTLLKQ